MTRVITTFSKKGYDLYGKKWLLSFTEHWPADVKAYIYCDFDLPVIDKNIVAVDFDRRFPHHKNFIDTVKDECNQKVIKFSYKSFVMIDQLEKCSEDFLIWLDGDVETLATVNVDAITGLCKNDLMACQVEHLVKDKIHIESGFIVWNLRHHQRETFTHELKEYYYNYKLLGMKRPYDGHIIGEIIQNKNIEINDLNKGIVSSGLQDKPEDTFLHPVLKKHFIHKIHRAKYSN